MKLNLISEQAHITFKYARKTYQHNFPISICKKKTIIPIISFHILEKRYQTCATLNTDNTWIHIYVHTKMPLSGGEAQVAAYTDLLTFIKRYQTIFSYR